MGQTVGLRSTPYADEKARASVVMALGHEARIELLWVKDSQQLEVRFSWWQHNRMIARPLDLPEDTLLELLERGITAGALSADFSAKLERRLEDARQSRG